MAPGMSAPRSDLALKFRRVDARMLENIRESQARDPEYVRTPWPSLNKACRGEGGGRGIGLGQQAILCGLTGAGKTLAALNVVDAAMRDGTSVLFFSLEMSAPQLLTRLRAIASGADILDLEWGSRFKPSVAAAADQEIIGRRGRLFLNVEPVHELADIRKVVREHVEQENVRLVVVDYAQLVTPAGRESDLFTRMSEISSQLRAEAQERRIVCLALSQLNRRERAGDVGLDSLFGSSRFAFDADLVLGLSSDFHKDDIQRRARTKLIVLKNRHGPTPHIPVEFDYATFRVREPELEGFEG